MTSSALKHSSRFSRDRWLVAVLTGAAALSAAILVFVVVFLARESWPALDRIGVTRFLSDDGWFPTSGRFELTPMLAGSLIVTLGSLLVAAPVGVGAAVFTQFYAPGAIARWYRRAMGVLAGVPSVVLGLFGLMTIVPWIARIRAPGASVLAGALLLALMILPTIVLMTDAAFAAVPRSQLSAAAALGYGRWTTIRRIALASARPSIVSAIVLALARAIGETMVVLMVCGNVVQYPSSPFSPVRTLTANIALEMPYATTLHRSALFVGGLLLVLAVGLAFWCLARFQIRLERDD
ncbi:MAG: phosphate ABC transporter permease subunit PstC [Planctomycetota bacterium]